MARRPSDARQRIVQAALGLFAARGYHNTGIAHILEQSGVQRGTLYHHFSSKEELGLAAIDEMARLLQEEGVARYLRGDAHPIDRMLKVIDGLPGTVKLPSGELLSSAAIRLVAAEPELRERLSTHLAESIARLEAVLRKGVAEGQIADNVDPHVLSCMFVITCEGVQFTSVMGLPQALRDEARSWLKEYLNSLRGVGKVAERPPASKA